MNSAIFYLTMFDKNTKNENTGGLVNEIFTGTNSEIPNSIFTCVYIITALSLINIVYKAYKIIQKNFKKKYSANAIV